jgi:hypothetical protein
VPEGIGQPPPVFGLLHRRITVSGPTAGTDIHDDRHNPAAAHGSIARDTTQDGNGFERGFVVVKQRSKGYRGGKRKTCPRDWMGPIRANSLRIVYHCI